MVESNLFPPGVFDRLELLFILIVLKRLLSELNEISSLLFYQFCNSICSSILFLIIDCYENMCRALQLTI